MPRHTNPETRSSQAKLWLHPVTPIGSQSIPITGYAFVYRWDGLDHVSHQALMMGTELVPETSIIFNHLTADSLREFYKAC